MANVACEMVSGSRFLIVYCTLISQGNRANRLTAGFIENWGED